jgi:hypothetical protein
LSRIRQPPENSATGRRCWSVAKPSPCSSIAAACLRRMSADRGEVLVQLGEPLA